jgi:hypothetical protein
MGDWQRGEVDGECPSLAEVGEGDPTTDWTSVLIALEDDAVDVVLVKDGVESSEVSTLAGVE